MTRAMLSALALLTLTLASGCAMCANPYDYCGPTFAGGEGLPCSDCQSCNPMARAGSILSPPLGTTTVAGEPGNTEEKPIRRETKKAEESPIKQDPGPDRPTRTTRRPQPSDRLFR